MNANKAKMKSEQNLITTVPQEEYDIIMIRIKYCVSVGQFKLWWEYISKAVILKLRSEGYSVKWNFILGGYNIRWK